MISEEQFEMIEETVEGLEIPLSPQYAKQLIAEVRKLRKIYEMVKLSLVVHEDEQRDTQKYFDVIAAIKTYEESPNETT